MQLSQGLRGGLMMRPL